VDAILDSRLIVTHPGIMRSRLLRLATYRRRGRVPKGMARSVRFYTDGMKLKPAQDTVILPRALTPVVQRIIPELKVYDRRLTVPAVDFRWRGRLRPDQQEAFLKLYRQGGGVLVAPPGAGKTVVGLALAAALGQPALWIVHTKPLMEQAVERAGEVLGLPRGGIGVVGGDHAEASFGTHLTVATVQTLAGQRFTEEQGIGTVIVDEAHHYCGALTYARVVHRLRGRYRFGLTATAERTDGLHPLMFALLGPAVEIPLELLVRLGVVVLPQVEIVPTSFRADPGNDWNDIQELRSVDRARNLLLCALAAFEYRRGRRVILLVERIEHTKVLAGMLAARFNTPAAAVSGVTAPRGRGRAFDALQAEGRQVLVATKVLDEGVDLPLADCLIQGAAQRSEPLLWQRIGRVMRRGKGKDMAVIYDVADLRVPSLAEQADERFAVYESLGFKVRRHQGGARVPVLASR
jgi:superfamily II DNA or RNA helicase